MARSVFSRALEARRWSLLGWVLSGLFLAGFVIAIYPVIRDNAGFTEVLAQLPDEVLSFMGTDAALFTTGFGYVQAELFSLMAPLLVLILAIGMGASATATEEATGTADLLLSMPIRRSSVVVQKTLALAAATATLVLAFVAVLLIGQVTVDLRLPVAGILGANLGLFLLGFFFGTMAFAVAAWTGKKTLGTAVAGGLAGLVFFLNGLAPLVPALERFQPLMPFHWYLTGDPLINGPTPWQLLLAAGAVLFAALSVAGFSRRDIGVFARLLPVLHRPVSAGSVVASSPGPLLRSVGGKAIWDRRRSFWWWLSGIGLLVALTAAFFPVLNGAGGDAFQQLIDAYPPEMLAMFGITDPGSVLTGGGFLSTRVYSTIGVVAVMAFAISMGTAALAGEEREGTADLLVAAPVARSRIVVEKAGAMFALLTALMAGVALIVTVADLIVGLDLTVEGIVAANLGLMLLAFATGSVALLVGAWSGRPGRSTATAVVFGVAGFLLNSFGAVVDRLEPFRPLSPFYWYQGDTNPLDQSLGWQQLLLFALGLAFVAIAIPFFRRREIGT